MDAEQRILKIYICPILSDGCETWTIDKAAEKNTQFDRIVVLSGYLKISYR